MNTEKIRNAYRLWRSNFSRRERKPKYGKKNSKVTYSVLLIMAFFPAENENRPLEDLRHSDFSHVPGRFLLSVRTKSKIENFVHWKLRPMLVFCGVSTHFSILSLNASALYGLRDCRSFYFLSLIKLTFLVSKGLLCLYDEQNNTWLLVDMKFLF